MKNFKTHQPRSHTWLLVLINIFEIYKERTGFLEFLIKTLQIQTCKLSLKHWNMAQLFVVGAVSHKQASSEQDWICLNDWYNGWVSARKM